MKPIVGKPGFILMPMWRSRMPHGMDRAYLVHVKHLTRIEAGHPIPVPHQSMFVEIAGGEGRFGCYFHSEPDRTRLWLLWPNSVDRVSRVQFLEVPFEEIIRGEFPENKHLTLGALIALDALWTISQKPKAVIREMGPATPRRSDRTVVAIARGDTERTVPVYLSPPPVVPPAPPPPPPPPVEPEIAADDPLVRRRYHAVAGHWRTYRSGRRVYVRPHHRGDAELGTVVTNRVLIDGDGFVG